MVVMGQQEILEILKEDTSRWFTLKELEGRLDMSRSNIANSLRRAKKWGDILFHYEQVRSNNGAHDKVWVKYVGFN